MDLRALDFDLLFEGRESATDSLLEPDDLCGQFGGIEASESKQVQNQLIHPGSGRADALEVILSGIIEQVIVVFEQFIAETAHRAEGRPEIMGNAIAKAVERLNCL